MKAVGWVGMLSIGTTGFDYSRLQKGDVIDRKSAFGNEFFHVAVGQREAQVPANRQQDDLRFKLAPLE